MEQHTDVSHPVVLGLDPHVRGIGFAAFEGPRDIIDWGATSSCIAKNYNARRRVSQLIRERQPDVLVIEDVTHSRRTERIKKLLASIEQLAVESGIPCEKIAPENVREAFVNFGATTKHEIAQKLVTFMPELEGRLPSKRQVWEAEDPHYSIFDAAAFAFSYYYSRAL